MLIKSRVETTAVKTTRGPTERCRLYIEGTIGKAFTYSSTTRFDQNNAIRAVLAQVREDQPVESDVRVSVIISTVDRAQYLERSLQALRHLRHPCFEVIVVEGPSADTSSAVLDPWESDIKRIACPVRNLSVSRNLGLRAASGDLVAFIDDDAIAESDWLDRLVEPFRDPAVVATGGAIRNWSGIRFQCRALTIDRAAIVRGLPPGAIAPEDTCPAFTGTNFCVRRQAAIAVGMFDTSYAYLLEESDMQRTLFEAGGRLVYAGQAEVHHMRAPNAHRDEKRVPTDYKRQLASITYFCLKHRAADDGSKVVSARLLRHLEIIFEQLRRLRQRELIDQTSCHRLIRSAFVGIREGVRLSISKPIENPSTSLSLAPELPFRMFPTLGQRRARVAIVARGRQHEAGRIAIEDLCALVAQEGIEVTLVRKSQQPRVAYFNGYWTHDCARKHRFFRLFPSVAQFWAKKELSRMDCRRKFEIIVDIEINKSTARVQLTSFEQALRKPYLWFFYSSSHRSATFNRRIKFDALNNEVCSMLHAYGDDTRTANFTVL